VFDQRVGLDPALHETTAAVCHACQAPLDAVEQADPRYVVGASCPYCYRSQPELMAARIATRQVAIRRATTPLPGAAPYENRRPVNIPAAHDGRELLAVLSELLPQIEPAEWAARCAAGRFTAEDGAVLTAQHRVRGGERVTQAFSAAAEPPVATDIRLLYEDEALVIIDKPAPLPMHPCGRFNRNTLQHILNAAYAPECPRPLHRLDANTTGLVAFARTRHFCQMVQRQFLAGTVVKRYLVRVLGHPATDAFHSTAAISALPGVLGTHAVDEEAGRPARTDFRVRERHADGTALLEARLSTGRTNQIRIHLWQLGHPVVGDPAYLPGGRLGDTQTLDTDAPPLQLHAWKLAFTHPLSGVPLEFESARKQDQQQEFDAYRSLPCRE
jgi:RluA family pseudouridine synthase